MFTNQHKNLNHVHKDSKDLVSVIITLGGNISGGETLFYDGVKTSDLGSRSQVLKNLHGKMIFGPFGKKIHEGTLWRGYRAIISFILTKQIFLHLFQHRDRVYNRYINTTDKKNIDDDGTGAKPKKSYKEETYKHLVVIHYRNCGIEIRK